MNQLDENWERALKVIPGGTQLNSKNPNLYLPGLWPSHYTQAYGCRIDTSIGSFRDFLSMGLGTCILGYSHLSVNDAVKRVIDQGSMSSLNPLEEIKLAEKLIQLHPWGELVRFARTGGEAMEIAVRISRAFSGREKLAYCGYHGWKDWYLAGNLEKSDDGMMREGVPRSLLGTAIPFEYNKISQLQEIVENEDIGSIILEPVRFNPPENNFLEKVRKIASDTEAILVFDEITSGFRESVGGIHKKYNIVPDIAVFGKALGNGFPIAAIQGKKEIMEHAKNSFISSTYWTERMGPTAALETIRLMEDLDFEKEVSVHRVNFLKYSLLDLAQKYNLDITISNPIRTLLYVGFNYPEEKEIRTLFTKEMYDRGFLTNGIIYLTYGHSFEDIKRYLNAVDDIFNIINNKIDEGKIQEMIQAFLPQDNFRRLT